MNNEICNIITRYAFGVEYWHLYSIALTEDIANAETTQKVYDLASVYARIASRLVCGYNINDKRHYLPPLYFELCKAINNKFESFINGESLPCVELPPQIESGAYSVRAEGAKIAILNASGESIACATIYDDTNFIASVGSVVVGIFDVAESCKIIGYLIKCCTIKELLKKYVKP